MAYQFKITRRVEFADTDMAGIMHFSNFFRFMEAAEGAFMRSLGLSVVLSRSGLEVCMPRVHADCDYSAPLHFEDEVLVHLLVEKKGTRSITYRFRFYRLNGKQPKPAAQGRLTLVCAKRVADGTMKAVPLPPVLADQIQEAPADILTDGDQLLPRQPETRRRPSHLRGLGHARAGAASDNRHSASKSQNALNR